MPEINSTVFLIITVDPSRIGKVTAGCGISRGLIIPGFSPLKVLEKVNGEQMIVKNFTVDGTKFSNQGDYIEAVIEEIEKCWYDIYSKLPDPIKPQLYTMIRVEDYVEYQKKATKFTDNKVSKMIGAIEYWVRSMKKTYPKFNYKAVKAQVIKTRWPDIILEKHRLYIEKDGTYPKQITFGFTKALNKRLAIALKRCYNYVKFDGTKHSMDSFRHLMDEFVFGDWKETVCEEQIIKPVERSLEKF